MDRNRAVCLFAAVVSPVAILAVRVVLSPWLTEYGSFPLFVIPVSLAAWCGGLWGGVMALVISIALSLAFLLPPAGHPLHEPAANSLCCFIISALPLIGFSEVLHRANRRLLMQTDLLTNADQEKNRMIALLAHELRNPIGVMTNALHLIGVRTGGQVERQHAIAERSLQQMARLIDDLLDVSRISTGKVPLHYDSLDLRALLEELCESWEPAAAEKSLTLRCAAPPGPVYVFADSQRLTQVFENLIGNAVKFTDTGGITLSLAVRRRSVCVRITDTGAGVSPGALPFIWEPFRQGIVNPPRGGLGLGLSVVKGLVELHAGSVGCESPGIGKGATFTVELPLEEGLTGRRATDGKMANPGADGSGRGDARSSSLRGGAGAETAADRAGEVSEPHSD